MSVWTIGLLFFLVVTSTGNAENSGFSTPVSPISYTSTELHAFRSQSLCSTGLFNSDIPKEMRRRKRGRSGGVRRRLRARKFKPYLPSVIMGNVQSLNNKIDELCANTKFLHDFRTASLMSFTETWLNSSHTDELVNIDGFKLLRGERTAESGKKEGECVFILMNNGVTLTTRQSGDILVLTISRY